MQAKNNNSSNYSSHLETNTKLSGITHKCSTEHYKKCILKL